MIIGKFTKQKSGDGYTGGIFAFGTVCQPVEFIPQQSGADFIVIESGEFELGAAWRRTSKEGKPYLSVKLDGPTLPAPVNCALIKQKDGSYSLVWTRRPIPEDDATAAT